MRIQRLDLLRYGHFTDLFVDLHHGEMDLHIIFGPNEAGKSTAMGAIEDLLFGIPATSPRNFLHDYAAMRVGAVLESDGQGLEVRRRKGNKDTLLSANDRGELMVAPESSEYLSGDEVRHIWICDGCDYPFETLIRFNVAGA
jgi:uncharacterized protein YhaN